MAGNQIKRITSFDKEKRLNGLWFGLIAGFWLGAGIWAWDAFLLSTAHGDLPWLKFALGTPFLIIIGGIAGWLTARFDQAAVGALVWLIASVCVVWIASHMPFEGLSWAVGLVDPNFAGLDIYPFVESARVRMGLLYVIVGIITAIAGGFEIFFVEGATSADHHLDRFLKLASCLVFFVPIGLLADNLINSPLRNPLQGVDDLIQFGIEARTESFSKEKQRLMGVRKLTPYQDFLTQPYRLIMGPYDPETLDEASVYTDFSGNWGMCAAVGTQPLVCRLSSERYLNKLDCLVHTGSPDICHLKLEAGVSPPPPEAFEILDQPPLKYGILGQRGTAVLVIAEDSQGDQVRCLFREAGDVFFEACHPVSKLVYDQMPLPPTATPSPTRVAPTPVASASIAFEPQAALIDPTLLRLPVLVGAPRYRISLSLADDLRSFHGESEVALENTSSSPWNEVYFHLLPNGDGSYGNGSLNILNTSLAGQAVATSLLVNDTVVKVPLTDALEPGESIAVKFEFRGAIPLNFGSGTTPAGYGIFNYADGVLALSGWYPILAVFDDRGWNLDAPSNLGDSVYSQTGLYQVSVSLPAGMLIAATGVEVELREEADRLDVRFESGPVRDFFMIASPSLKSVSQQVNGVQVNSYFPPGKEFAGSQALSVAVETLKIFNEKFGKYPYRELDVSAAPMRYALGVEFPGIVMIGEDLYDDPAKPEFAVSVAHEVAHQWWYSVVGNDVFDEPWLDEALATYSSSLYYEYALGEEDAAGLRAYWQERYDRLLEEGGDDAVTAALDYFESLNKPSIYGAVVYTKGALFFQALREEIGDQAFFKGLQDYYQAKFFGIARADDLLSAFERSAGRSLDNLYQAWLYK